MSSVNKPDERKKKALIKKILSKRAEILNIIEDTDFYNEFLNLADITDYAEPHRKLSCIFKLSNVGVSLLEQDIWNFNPYSLSERPLIQIQELYDILCLIIKVLKEAVESIETNLAISEKKLSVSRFNKNQIN